MALTQKKMDFAWALMSGKSNKDAAIAVGLSVKTASQAGARLAADPDVKRYLAQIKREAKAAAAPSVKPAVKPPGESPVGKRPAPPAEPPVSPSPVEGEPRESDAMRKAKDAARKAMTAAKKAVDAAADAGLEGIDGTRKIFDDPKAFLMAVINDERTEQRLRVQSAIAMMGDTTKRDLATAGKKGKPGEGEKPAESKFGRRAPPRLVSNGGSSV